MAILLLLNLILLARPTLAQIEEDCADDEDWEDQEEDTEDTSEDSLHHKAFWPLERIEYLGTFLLVVILMLTNAAGVGGGGAILPIMLLFGFTANVAVAMSSTIIIDRKSVV